MRRILMCKPLYYDVIHPNLNVHMNMKRPVDKSIAMMQYWNLTNLLRNNNCDVQYINPQPNLVDMVFAANGGLIYPPNNTAIVSKFRAIPRQKETQHWNVYLRDLGYNIKIPQNFFEGQGDALFSHNYNKLWYGHGFRTDSRVENELKEFLPKVDVKSLKLIDSKYYHLDTCFCVINEENAMYIPHAFDDESVDKIKGSFSKLITVEGKDAENFACNAININDLVIMHNASSELKDNLINTFGVKVIENNMSEFMKSGGSSKCCVLEA